MAKQYKNDIFEVLKQIDNKNYNYYNDLESENQKEIQPYTLCRWMSAVVNDSDHKKLNKIVNDNVNVNFWELSKYKDLQWKLLCTCGNKKFNRHQWVSQNKPKTDKKFNAVKSFYSNLNDDELKLKYKNMTSDNIKDIQKFLGLMDK